jgi:gamma-glutamylcyclotransferase (GGCT)/AIG2-like uncharacterized protein YtfP
MKKRIFVYGTLRKGNGLNPYLDNFKYIGEATLCGYDMYTNGYFPMIVKGSGNVLGEVYEIEGGKNDIRRLDDIESAYNRKKVEAIIDGAWIQVEAYIWRYNTENLKKVETGDFNNQVELNSLENIKVKYKRYVTVLTEIKESEEELIQYLDDNELNVCDKCGVIINTNDLIWITAEDFEPKENEVISARTFETYDSLCYECYLSLVRSSK